MKKPKTWKELKNHPAVEMVERVEHDLGESSYRVYLNEGWTNTDLMQHCRTIYASTKVSAIILFNTYVKQLKPTPIMDAIEVRNDKIQRFKEFWNTEKSFISLDLTDDEILNFMDRHPKVEMAVDQAADYLLSQGLASDVLE